MGLWKSRGEKEREFAEEVKAHLEMATSERVERGENEDAASTAARREFGNVETVKDAARQVWGGRWIGELAEDARFGLRMLGKNRGFAAVAIGTLALGIGANAAVFSVIENVLLRPLPYAHPQELVEVWNAYLPGFPRIGISPGDYSDWTREAKSFSSTGAYAEIAQGLNLTGDADPQRVQSSQFSSGLLPTLGIQPALGRNFSPEEDKPGGAPVVMLGNRFWHSRFGGDPRVIGKEITLDGEGFTIAGVLPSTFQIMPGMDLWMPMGRYPDDLSSHVHHGIYLVGRLQPGVSAEQAQAEFTALNKQEESAFPDTHRHWTAVAKRLEDPAATQMQTTLWLLFGAVGLVLLIACANLTNLLLARNNARDKEMALRAALGARQWRLVRQLLTESVVLAFLGGALGLAVAEAGIRILGAMAPAGLGAVEKTQLSWPVLGFTAGVCLLTGVACGLPPALRARPRGLSEALKQGSKGSTGLGARRIQNALVVCELALAIAPLAGAGLLLRSFERVMEVSPGFAAEHLLSMQIPQASLSFAKYSKLSNQEQIDLGKKQALEFQQIAEKVEALPGVISAGGITTLPLGDRLREASRFLIEGQPIPDGGLRPVAQTRTVSAGYFSTLKIPLLRGRTFTPDDWTLQNTVINEAMAKRFWAGEEPIGKRINLCSLAPQPCWFSIVGVVGNVHQFGLDAGATYDVYLTGGWTPYLVIRTANDPAAIATAAGSAVHELDATLPVTEVRTMDELLSDSVAARKFVSALTAVFAVLALLLSAVGIYGVMSYTVGQRVQEIGIRMALGAQRRDILRSVLGSGWRMAMVGVAIGTAGSLVLARFLASFLYGVGQGDPLTFAGVAAVLLGVATAACWIPARRAMRVDPMVALRYE